MFEEFLMYWLLWLLFVVIFFFMEQGVKRTVLTTWLLLIIGCSSIYIDMNHMQFSLSMMLIIFGAVIYLVENSFSFLKLYKTFIIMIFYSAILFWQLVAPVWFFLSGYFLIPVLIVFMVIILSRRLIEVYAYLILGISLGQFLFDMILNVYQLHHEIGNTAFFIQVTLSVLLVIVIRSYYTLSAYVSGLLARRTSP